LAESHTTVVIPFDDRVLLVRSLNRAQIPSWFSEVAQTLDAISRSQFFTSGGGFGEGAASWHGLSQESLRDVTGAARELYVAWVLAY
jgi:hypothetical protein